jgi:predicted transcriptional regulator
MRVLLPIKPEFASRILAGTKKYEYRRVIFKQESVKTILIYATAPISKIVGEFSVSSILSNSPKDIWNKTKRYAGISKDRFFEYFSDKSTGYAIRIESPTTYETPMSLSSMVISAPPQSFIYLKENKKDKHISRNSL